MRLVHALPGIVAEAQYDEQYNLSTASTDERPPSPGFPLPGALQPDSHRCPWSHSAVTRVAHHKACCAVSQRTAQGYVRSECSS